ncbi:hypothetical protein Hanom_Chr03g00217861 [Helianthus anomalus]
MKISCEGDWKVVEVVGLIKTAETSGVSTVVVLTTVEVSTFVIVEDGSGEDGFVFYFFAGCFCGGGIGLGVEVDGFLIPAVVCPAGLSDVCFGGEGDLGYVARGGLLCLWDFLLTEVPRSFVVISQFFNSFCSFFQILSFVAF